MLQAYINISKSFDKQKLISVAVLRHSRLNGINAEENICLFFVFSYATLT